MITHIEIEGFKSFRKVSLDLGGLNVFVGTNASGKSNFLEALRVLQGIGYGLTIAEIFDGKPKGATNEVWEGIRGGSRYAPFRSPTASAHSDLIRLRVKLKSPKFALELDYEIELLPSKGLVWEEGLSFGQALKFRISGRGSRISPEGFDMSRPVLQQQAVAGGKVLDGTFELAETCSSILGNAQFLNPSPVVLRGYSAPIAVGRMGERGENFAGLVKAILASEANGDDYTSWLKELTPAELDEIKIWRGALNEPLFAIKKGCQETPAPLLSDGTLRFAAMAAAFFQPDIPEILMIEEIENGIHPTRLRLLVELLKSQSESGHPQVMATSHSPLVVGWLREEDYRTTFFCQKDEESGASNIKPLTSIPRFLELAREQSAGDLFAQGWLETAP